MINLTLGEENFQIIKFNQYDKNYTFKIKLVNYTPIQGDVIKIEWKINNSTIIQSDYITVSNTNILTVKLLREVTLNAGKGHFNVVVENTRDTTRKATFKSEIEIVGNSVGENDVSSVFTETAKEQLDNTINQAEAVINSMGSIIQQIEDSDIITEVHEARGGNSYLKDRLDKSDTKLSEAYGKANNPVETLETAGYKIPLNMLSDEVKAAITGQSTITTSNGLDNNKGVNYPLKAITRNGILSDISDTLKDGILDIKIHGAKPDKYYKLSYIGNGITFDDVEFYGVFLLEFDKDTYATESTFKYIFGRTDHNFEPPIGITTWNLKNDTEGITLTITLDFNVLTEKKYDMNSLTTYSGYSAIIDENCYILDVKEDKKNETVYNMAVKRVGREYYVKYRYNNSKNLVIRFGGMKNNKFTHPLQFYWDNDTKISLDFDNLISFQTNNSDWLSPYGIMAVNNPLNNNSYTVGGAHGTSGSTGFPTGLYIDSNIYVDNELVNDGEALYCNEAVIKSIHRIAASNVIDTTTGDLRYSALETTIWKITKGNMEVGVTLQALEDINVTRYAGIQATKSSVWSSKLYVPNDNNIVFDMSNIVDGFNSKAYPDFTSDRFVMYNNNCFFVGYMCNDIGVATSSKLDGEIGIYLTAGEYGKIYFHNIKGNTVNMAANDIIYYSGGYSIQERLKCTHAEGSYYINKNGKRIYCADFFKNIAATYLYVLPEDYNKKITILNKSDGITVDNYISPMGLKLSCSGGYGQIEFTCE